MKKIGLFILLFVVSCASLVAQSRTIGAHDPVIIKEGDTYYVMYSGRGVNVLSSKDMKNWEREEPAFTETPKWITAVFPSFRGSYWAPDISYHNGQYYLYYAVSSHAKNTSYIGVATNKTLNSKDKNYKWVDQGPVLCSHPGVDDWNAIDANLIVSDEKIPYLVFGSHWDGLRMVRLTDDLLSVYPEEKPFKVASQENRVPAPTGYIPPIDPGDNTIEAPFIYKKGNYYYLFISTGHCCQGANSTYKVAYGRSEKVTGPYFDREGTDLRIGGGTILVDNHDDFHGVGHNGIGHIDGKDFIVYHGYDARDEGRSKLLIYELDWDKNGWPVMGKLVF